MKQLFQIPALIETIRTLSDKSLKLTVTTTRELTPEEELMVLRLKQREGWMVFSPQEIEMKDIPEEPVPEFKGEKTPAQRLRGVIYKIWELKTSKKEDFESFYKRQMEKIISRFKEYLEN